MNISKVIDDETSFEDIISQCLEHNITSLSSLLLSCENGYDVLVQYVHTYIQNLLKSEEISPDLVDQLDKHIKTIFGSDYDVWTIASIESRNVEYKKFKNYKHSYLSILHKIELNLRKLQNNPIIIDIYINNKNKRRNWYFFNIIIDQDTKKCYMYPNAIRINKQNNHTDYFMDYFKFDINDTESPSNSIYCKDLKLKHVGYSKKYIKYLNRTTINSCIESFSDLYMSESDFINSGRIHDTKLVEGGIIFYGNYYGSNNIKKLYIKYHTFKYKTNIYVHSNYLIKYGILKYSEHPYEYEFANIEVEDYFFEELRKTIAFNYTDIIKIKIQNPKNYAYFNIMLSNFMKQTCPQFVSFLDCGDSINNIHIKTLEYIKKHKIVYDHVTKITDVVPETECYCDGTYLKQLLEEDDNLIYNGRTIYKKLENNTLLCIKLMKSNEEYNVLKKEVTIISELAGKNIIPHLAKTQDINVYKEMIDLEHIGVNLQAEIKKSNYEYSLNISEGYYKYIAYYISHPSIPVDEFTIYAENMSQNDYSLDEIREAYMRNIRQAANLIINGYVHTSLINLFHNTEDDRRFITTIDILNLSEARFGTGRLDAIFQNAKWSNIRKIGISDFAEIMSIDDFKIHCDNEYFSYCNIYSSAPNKLFFVRAEAINSQYFSWVIDLLYNEFMTNINSNKTINNKQWFTDLLFDGYSDYMTIIYGDVDISSFKNSIGQIVNEIEYIFSLKYMDYIISGKTFDIYPHIPHVLNHLFDDKCTKAKLITYYDTVKNVKEHEWPTYKFPRGWKTITFIKNGKYYDYHHIGWLYMYPVIKNMEFIHLYQTLLNERKYEIINNNILYILDIILDKYCNGYLYRETIREHIINWPLNEYVFKDYYFDTSGSINTIHLSQINDMIAYQVMIIFEKNIGMNRSTLKLCRNSSEVYDCYLSAMNDIKLSLQIEKDLGLKCKVMRIQECGTFIDIGNYNAPIDNLKEYLTNTMYQYIDAGAVNGAFPLQTLAYETQIAILNCENDRTIKTISTDNEKYHSALKSALALVNRSMRNDLQINSLDYNNFRSAYQNNIITNLNAITDLNVRAFAIIKIITFFTISANRDIFNISYYDTNFKYLFKKEAKTETNLYWSFDIHIDINFINDFINCCVDSFMHLRSYENDIKYKYYVAKFIDALKLGQGNHNEFINISNLSKPLFGTINISNDFFTKAIDTLSFFL